MKKDTKKILKNILELIEDKDFPARRVMFDYVVQLLPFEDRKKAELMAEKFYHKKGEEWKKRSCI